MRLVLWALVLAAVALPPMLVSLGQRGSQHSKEADALLTAQETWIRQHNGESSAWLRPTLNGEVQVGSPPLFVWITMLAWSGLDPDSSSLHCDILFRARLVSVLLAMVMVLSTCFIGRVLIDSRSGFFAGLVAATMVLTLQQARIATQEIHQSAWIALAVAAAVSAMNPGSRRTPWRSLACWVIAGVALACACLSNGPLAFLFYFIPLAVCLAFKRMGAFRCFASILFACLLAAPWYVYHLANEPGAWQSLWHGFGLTSTAKLQFWHDFVKVVAGSMPWTLWCAAGLALPLVVHRLRTVTIMIPWLWAVVAIIAVGVIATPIAIVITPLALAAALAWRELEREVKFGSLSKSGKGLPFMHWFLVLGVSLAFGPFLAEHHRLVDMGLLENMVVHELPRWPAMMLTSVLVILALIGAICHWRRRTTIAALTMAVWVTVAATSLLFADATTKRQIDYFESQSHQVARLIGNESLGFLLLNADDQPAHDFLLFLRRIVLPVKPDDLGNHEFVMAEVSAEHNQLMHDSGYKVVCDFQDGPHHDRLLWQRANYRSD